MELKDAIAIVNEVLKANLTPHDPLYRVLNEERAKAIHRLVLHAETSTKPKE